MKLTGNRGLGMNWIRPVKRLAIYLRDGFACAYCSGRVEDGVQFTLDHLRPRSKGGTNRETNLVTCCVRCNSSRSDRPWREFAGTDGTRTHIAKCRRRSLNISSAMTLMKRRGGFTAAIYGNVVKK